MSSTSTLNSSSTLSAESALAARTLRLAKEELKTWAWLSNPRMDMLGADLASSPCPVGDSIDQLIEPLLEGASEWSARRAKPTSAVLPKMLSDIRYSVPSLEEPVRNRLTAMVVLPVYRSLGTAELDDGFDEMRRRCMEAQILLKLVALLGSDLSERINDAQKTDLSPYCILKRDLEIDLSRISDIVARTIGGYDPDSDDFDSFATSTYEDPGQGRAIPDWACPDLLWRLAGQLDSSASNLTLPRQWVNTPIPWQSVDKHWKELSQRMRSAGVGTELDKTDGASRPESSEHASAPDTSSSEVESAQNEDLPATRVMIAEVMGHNDPAYTNHLGKRISICSHGKRPILTAAIQLRDDASTRSRKRTSVWQQKLLNALQESEEVGEVFAFLTSDAKLLINLLDIDRMDATELIRDAMEMSLGPNSEFDSEANNPPIYFVGMAACAIPSSRLEAADLVEPAIRCLQAAQSQKRSAIKSIEVF